MTNLNPQDLCFYSLSHQNLSIFEVKWSSGVTGTQNAKESTARQTFHCHCKHTVIGLLYTAAQQSIYTSWPLLLCYFGFKMCLTSEWKLLTFSFWQTSASNWRVSMRNNGLVCFHSFKCKQSCIFHTEFILSLNLTFRIHVYNFSCPVANILMVLARTLRCRSVIVWDIYWIHLDLMGCLRTKMIAKGFFFLKYFSLCCIINIKSIKKEEHN